MEIIDDFFRGIVVVSFIAELAISCYFIKKICQGVCMSRPDKDLIIIGGGAAGLSAAQYGSKGKP